MHIYTLSHSIFISFSKKIKPLLWLMFFGRAKLERSNLFMFLDEILSNVLVFKFSIQLNIQLTRYIKIGRRFKMKSKERLF